MISSYRHDKSPFPSSGGGSDAAPDSGGSSDAPSSGRASGVTPDSGRLPAVVRYLDLVLVVVAAPILLLIGVPAVCYGVGAGAWLVLRVIGVAFERYTSQTSDPRREISLRLAYLLARIFLLALAVILVRRESGRDPGLTTLLVIVFAFTIQLVISFLERPRRR
jgi:hypothetical protein